MKKLFTFRSIVSLALLLIAMNALASALKVSIIDVEGAAFFPVAAFVLTLAYALGFGQTSARRVWTIVLISGLIFAFIESAKLVEPLKVILRSIPQFELDVIRWLFERKIPDTPIFKTQFIGITTKLSIFISRLLTGSIEELSVREFIWDLPIIPIAAWAGWKTSRYNQPLLALVPALALHAFILYYTGKDMLSLQITAFALILLVGINQQWNTLLEQTQNTKKTTRETYSAMIILSIALTIGAGIMPSISIKEAAQRLVAKDVIGQAIGLERETALAYAISGLPRQHLIGLNPTLSQTVIFTVKTGELGSTDTNIINEAVPRHYWRWLTYDMYTGQGWSTSPIENNSYPANESLLSISEERYTIIHQQVEKAFRQDKRLYWTGTLTRATEPFNASWRTSPANLSSATDSLLGADMLGAMTEKQSYQADSIVPLISANQLRASSETYPPEIRARYLSLPETVPQRVLDLAKELTANENNPYDKAKAIESYLRTYPYSLELPAAPPNKDIADYFLFELKTGYCDYYATSMVVLARAVGLPARLVIGYANGTYDPINAKYIVREADAHSWVEIYFSGVGWVEFEPTASELQLNLLDELGQESTPSIIPFSSTSLRQGIAYTKGGKLPQANIYPIVILLGFIVLFSSLRFLHIQGLLKTHKTIGSIYEYIYFHGKKIYTESPPYETPSVFAGNLIRKLRSGYQWLVPALDEIKLITELYIQETYSAHPISKDEHHDAVRAWRKLFWRLLYARMLRL